MHDEGTPERRARTTRKLENKYKKLRGGKRRQRRKIVRCMMKEPQREEQEQQENWKINIKN